jgi:hypothetical protein
MEQIGNEGIFNAFEHEVVSGRSTVFFLVDQSELLALSLEAITKDRKTFITKLINYIKYRTIDKHSTQLKIAWCYFLQILDKQLIHSGTAPESLSSFQSWIHWAEKLCA